MTKYTRNLFNKCNGDISFIKKILSNKASLATNKDELAVYADSFQELEVLSLEEKR